MSVQQDAGRVVADEAPVAETGGAALRPGAVRLALLALSAGGFGIGTTEFVTMGVLPDIAADLGVSIPQAGHLISLYALGVVVGAPLLAVLGARVGRTTLLVLLMAAFTAGNLASAVAPGFLTLELARFASGLPHGAYFGIAAVVASRLVPPDRRGRAVAQVMLGLTVANVVGVPAATLLGQTAGWRSTYWLVTGIGVLSVVAVLRLVPPMAALPGASARTELDGLQRSQVWLTLGVGAVGFGGFFAVYSYVAPLLTEVAGLPERGVPVVLGLFGIGMTVGTVVGGRLADWDPVRSIWLGLGATLAVLLLLQVTAHAVVPAALTLLLLGGSGALMLPSLQARLLDVAKGAESLASAMQHAALNLANALGAWLGGLVLAAGAGWTAPALVGAGLAVAGGGVYALALRAARG